MPIDTIHALLRVRSHLKAAHAELINVQAEPSNDAEFVTLREAVSFLSMAESKLAVALIAHGWLP